MHKQRSDASAVTLNGKIYICGGFSVDECLLTAECYDPDHDQWALIELMHVSGRLRHRRVEQQSVCGTPTLHPV
ncbi:hypothetical protein KOW79_017718 [Hemibagrus wyckioides]|uniref:Uncharacterized protein n=1 Tax=Hemibagrus wyckioides TaxID=337641 RepID=A0A9D3ND15_9TELE|nr:hypothetical protein KOW79_017718 [Hemibagrus wyckioides]